MEAAAQVGSMALRCAEAPLWSLTDTDVIACLDRIHHAEQALAAAKAHLVRQIDARGIPIANHHRSCAGWLRERLRVSTRTARTLVETARALDQRPDLDQALSNATVNTEQTTAIIETLAALPATLGDETTAKAETVLIGWSADFDPHGLRRLGTRILDHVAPELADEADAARLARQEDRAHKTRSLTLSTPVDGRVRVSGWLDVESAAIVNAALDPLCTPRRNPRTTTPDSAGSPDPASGTDPASSPDPACRHAIAFRPHLAGKCIDERNPGQRRADALVDVCRLALRTGDLPVNGGNPPQLAVTISYDSLRREVGVGTLDTGGRLTAAQVRRLACDSHLLPAVLDGVGQVLDVGPTRRLITGALRRALALRDRGCAFPGCDRPPRWCEGHHIRSWASGGPTSLDNSVLLCGHHHRLIHHSDWVVRLSADGHPEFLPPPHLDPDRRPRRNAYHHRT